MSIARVVVVSGAPIVLTSGIVLTSCGPSVVCAGSVLVKIVVDTLDMSIDTVLSILLIGAIDIIGEGEVVSIGRLSGTSTFSPFRV